MNESYFYQALKQISGATPPRFMMQITVDEYLTNMGEEKSNKLADWASSESNVPWATGQGVIDAAIALVEGAVENGNIIESIFPEHQLCLSGGKHVFHKFGNQKIRRCNNCSCLEVCV